MIRTKQKPAQGSMCPSCKQRTHSVKRNIYVDYRATELYHCLACGSYWKWDKVVIYTPKNTKLQRTCQHENSSRKKFFLDWQNNMFAVRLNHCEACTCWWRWRLAAQMPPGKIDRHQYDRWGYAPYPDKPRKKGN